MFKKTIIPFKNLILQRELNYLEEQAEQGWQLVNKGPFCYRFKKIPPQKLSYGIDLLPQELAGSTLDGWAVVLDQKVRFKKMHKIYYLAHNPNIRLLQDETILLDYYSYYGSRFLTLANCSILPLLMSWVLATAAIKLPMFVYIAACLLAIPFYYFIRSYSACESAEQEIRTDRGLLSGFEPNYILGFKNLTPQQQPAISSTLKQLGQVQKIDERYYRLKSPLNKAELFEEIVALTHIDRQNLTLVNLGDFYVMI